MKNQERKETLSLLFVVVAAVCIVLMMADFTEAKRGCSAFGHACFGGHGRKRSDTNTGDISPEDTLLPFSEGRRNVPASDQLDPSDLELEEPIPMEAFRSPSFKPIVQIPFSSLSPVIRQWLQTYRRNRRQEENVL